MIIEKSNQEYCVAIVIKINQRKLQRNGRLLSRQKSRRVHTLIRLVNLFIQHRLHSQYELFLQRDFWYVGSL
jgi:hypothetical protein